MPKQKNNTAEQKKALKARFQRKHTDLAGIDFGKTATKLVRLKKSGNDISLIGIEQLPPVDFKTDVSQLQLPRHLHAYYGCLCYSTPDAIARVINTPLKAEETTLPENKLRELLSVKSEFRVVAKLIERGKGRQDSCLLVVAVPQDDVSFMLNMFPAGPPAPASLEVSGLATITAFLHARGEECADKTVCLIEAGEEICTFVFITKGRVFLLGKQNFGARALREKLCHDLEVDEELATSILSDRSINISASLSGVMAPFIKQISISKDFVERHEGCQITQTYLSGGLALLPSWKQEIAQRLNTEIIDWSPLENIQLDIDLPEETRNQAVRFSAAVGAALGGFEEE